VRPTGCVCVHLYVNKEEVCVCVRVEGVCEILRPGDVEGVCEILRPGDIRHSLALVFHGKDFLH